MTASVKYWTNTQELIPKEITCLWEGLHTSALARPKFPVSVSLFMMKYSPFQCSRWYLRSGCLLCIKQSLACSSVASIAYTCRSSGSMIPEGRALSINNWNRCDSSLTLRSQGSVLVCPPICQTGHVDRSDLKHHSTVWIPKWREISTHHVWIHLKSNYGDWAKKIDLRWQEWVAANKNKSVIPRSVKSHIMFFTGLSVQKFVWFAWPNLVHVDLQCSIWIMISCIDMAIIVCGNFPRESSYNALLMMPRR